MTNYIKKTPLDIINTDMDSINNSIKIAVVNLFHTLNLHSNNDITVMTTHVDIQKISDSDQFLNQVIIKVGNFKLKYSKRFADENDELRYKELLINLDDSGKAYLPYTFLADERAHTSDVLTSDIVEYGNKIANLCKRLLEYEEINSGWLCLKNFKL